MENSLPIYQKGEAREIAKQRCREIDVSINTLDDLVTAELNQQGAKNRTNLFIDFDRILSEED